MDFNVQKTGEALQGAVMRLAPGEASGPKGNEHADSEQILYVVEGQIEGEIGDRTITLHPGESVIVPKGVAHRFTNATNRPVVTFNAYAPPAY